jgi:membrane protein implicated in regulation of membrane protease activity
VSFFLFLDHWWNLPFLVMLGLVGAFFVLQLVGLIGHDADADPDADTDADADGDADGDVGDAFHEALSFFGVGRVPFMVVWGTLFIFTGFAGLFFNRVAFVRLGGHYPGWLFALSLLASLIAGLAATRLAARLAGKLVDTGGRGSSRKHELVGEMGVVASARVDGRFGEVRVRDQAGNEMIVHARLPGGAALSRGASVVLIDYEDGRELFLVVPSGLDGKTG